MYVEKRGRLMRPLPLSNSSFPPPSAREARLHKLPASDQVDPDGFLEPIDAQGLVQIVLVAARSTSLLCFPLEE